MHNLMTLLKKLYLPSDSLSVEALTQHLPGQKTLALSMLNTQGLTRAMVIIFNKVGNHDEDRHWTRLCSVANTLQSEFGFPAPAVSISGDHGYGLWLSLESPVAAEDAQKFVQLLHAAYFPDMELAADSVRIPVELPPCLHAATGMWAAFIDPGLGASFADEAWLEMAPPIAGQIALLKDLHSISAAQFNAALKQLQAEHDPVSVANRASPSTGVIRDGLLLRDATLEDVINFLHSKNIEPTFRHRLPE